MKDAIEPLLQRTGDAICYLFEQMRKGEWVDSEGHPVHLNAAMIGMKDVLQQLGDFRHEHLGYAPFDVKGK